MINLLSKCSVFLKVDSGLDNYLQTTGWWQCSWDVDSYSDHSLSGIPLSELDGGTSNLNSKTQPRKPTEITLVRSRIFYAKPATTAKGLVHAGFKHIRRSIHFIRTPAVLLDTTTKYYIDALNRYPYISEGADTAKNCHDPEKTRQQNEAHTTKLMMHIFPRQFSLHNVFTSPTDKKQTGQKFHDYTFREDEINKNSRIAKRPNERPLPKLPKRLRGATRALVQRLQILHARCSYFEMLRHYCPTFLDESHGNKDWAGQGKMPTVSIPASGRAAQVASPTKRPPKKPHANAATLPEYKSVVELSCPTACVSAFCRAVLSKIIPDSFWGGEKDCRNKIVFLRKVDHFIKLRRFEMISLHEIAQDFKVFIKTPANEITVAVHSPRALGHRGCLA